IVRTAPSRNPIRPRSARLPLATSTLSRTLWSQAPPSPAALAPVRAAPALLRRHSVASQISLGPTEYEPNFAPAARFPPPAQPDCPAPAAPPAFAPSPAGPVLPHLAIRRYPAVAPACSRRTRSALRSPFVRDWPPACRSRGLPAPTIATTARPSPPSTSCKAWRRASYPTLSALW